MEHSYTDLHSPRHEPELFSHHLPLVLCRSTNHGQISTLGSSAGTTAGDVHGNCHLLWRIHIAVCSIPEWAAVGTQHHSRWPCVLSRNCCVAYFLPTKNYFRIVNHYTFVNLFTCRVIIAQIFLQNFSCRITRQFFMMPKHFARYLE